jgi:hypothetical protein
MSGKTSHDTPAFYSREEVNEIRAAVRDPAQQPICPRCREQLTVGPRVMWAGEPIRELRCPSCNRCLMVDDTPGAFGEA